MRKELLDLIKRDAFFKQQIKLASGKMSDYYVDLRRVTLSPEGVYYISHLVWEIIKNDSIDAVGGPTLGADPIVSGVCYLAFENKKKIKGFLIRKEAKKHGRQNLVEGKELIAGERVVLFDDVATSGGSLIKGIEALRADKIEVVKTIVVLDRQEGARENLAKINCPLYSLFTKDDLF